MKHSRFRVTPSGGDHRPSKFIKGAHAAHPSADLPFRLITNGRTINAIQPVTSGLCLPKGQLHHAAAATIVREGLADEPAQTDVLNRWSDGSIRWLLASWVLRQPGEQSAAILRLRPVAIAAIDSDASGSVVLRQSGARLDLHMYDLTTDRPRLTELQFTPQLRLPTGHLASLETSTIHPEVNGAVRCVYRIDCRLNSDRRITLQLRLELWPSAGLINVSARFRNARRASHKGGLWDLNDPGSFHFHAIEIRVAMLNTEATVIRWKAEDDSNVRQLTDGRLQITQHASGGRAWANTNHQTGTVTRLLSRGYDADSPAGTVRGYRARPVVSMASPDSCLTMIVPEFWQKFPTSLTAEESTLTLGLFPEQVDPHELQGGEQCTQSFWLSTAATDPHLNDLNWTQRPGWMQQPAAWIQAANVFDWFPESVEHPSAARYRRYIAEATTGACSIAARRETIDEYGWRHFGDIPADHEQTHYAGSNTIISHYNNQYDLVFGGILNLLASGDSRWRELFDPLARHVMDIDVYHTAEDRAAFNGGLFWHTDHYVDAKTSTHRTYSALNQPEARAYGGGPSNEHNYTTGLLYYYFLTGSPEAHETVRSLADWVIAMDDGTRTIFGLLDGGPTGLATSTVDPGYHGPGRGAGNSINALLDAWILTSEDRYLSEAEELICRVTHPFQDCDDLELLDAETHWSYTVCLTALGRYLGEMNRAGRRSSCYARVRATLCHFGRWMVDNERPTLSQPDTLEYITEAWAAQDFRKANVLRITASCCDDQNLARQMQRRADELNDAAWQDLYSFGEKHLTARCLAIVMTEGLRDVFHRTSGSPTLPAADEAWTDGDWTMFVPQKERVARTLRSPGGVLRAIAGAFCPTRWIRAVNALRRQF